MSNKQPVMQDIQMDLNPDPMCIPTLATYSSFGDAKSFALDLRNYIEFVLINDPMDPVVIY